MNSIQDPCFYDPAIAPLIHRLGAENRLVWTTQGRSLVPLAKELYEMETMPDVRYLPNPVDIDFDFNPRSRAKQNRIIFLGRLEAQKRVWLVCEIAKRLPQYEFHIVGQHFRFKKENIRMLEKYRDGSIPNLYFEGHLDGEKKRDLLKTCKILINTSIWEGIPISWLEALSFGTLLVSNLDNENLVSRFGVCTGSNLGDGFGGVDSYVNAIQELMTDEARRCRLAEEAIRYTRETHGITRFVHDLRSIIRKAAGKTENASSDNCA